MSKTTSKQAQPDCVLCGVVFFGNPLGQHAETYVQPSGRYDWICQACRRIKMRLDVALRRAALDWQSSLEGKKCERCDWLVDQWHIQHDKYRWAAGGYDWEFHCQNCYVEYHRQRYTYSCDVELLHCEECLFVMPANAAKDAGWYVDITTQEAYCSFCKIEPGQTADGEEPLSCVTIPQEKTQVDSMRRFDLLWVTLGTQILTLAAIGLNWRSVTLSLVCVSTITVIARLFARVNQLRELLARNGVQM